MDMAATVIPKSDQLNADDLMGAPRTVRISKVSGTSAPDQPVAVHFEGDDGRPYKPCKSMRRVMIAAWGADASQYVGRAMTLYRDPKVAFGGMEVGGIRISHMSHIERDITLALTVTKAKRSPYVVRVLKEEQQSAAFITLGPDGKEYRSSTPEKWVDACKRALAKMPDAAAVLSWERAMEPHLASVPEDARAAVLDAARERTAALDEEEGA